MRFYSLFELFAFCLVGCGEQKLRTGDYYRQNSDERKSMLEKCEAENKKGVRPEGNFAQNCDTARSVEISVMTQSIRNKIMK